MRLVINQSNYIPWKGYFDLIRAADHFIIYDTAQFTKNDWRNRNLIKTADGSQWLTIPVQKKFGQTVRETEVQAGPWARKHWKAIETNYSGTPGFQLYEKSLGYLYKEIAQEKSLSKINFWFLTAICDLLGITTKISWSHLYPMAEGKTERLIGLCKSIGADEYISGPSAKDYIDRELFREAGIKLTFVNYAGYPQYPQKFGVFDHRVSILDLLFNTGPEAINFMKDLAGRKDG